MSVREELLRADLDTVVRETAAAPRRRGWLVRRALATADVVALILAFLAAEALTAGDGAAVDRVASQLEIALFILTLPGWIVVAKLYGLYDRDQAHLDHATAEDLVSIFHLVTVGSWVFFAGSWATGLARPDIQKLLSFWVLAVVLVPAARGVARGFCRRRPAYLQNTLIVGAGDVGLEIAAKLRKHPEYGVNLLGFVDDRAGVDVIGSLDRLPEIVSALDVERVILGFSDDLEECRRLELVRSLQELDGVQIDLVPRLHDVLSPGVAIHTVEGLPLLALPASRLSRSSAILKRSMDVALASIALVASAPLVGLAALLIKIDSRGPVFFRQMRIGSEGQPFAIFKFRSMVADADDFKSALAHLNAHARNGDARLFKIDGDPRVTRVGRVLRRYWIDELPQLLNVVRGEMSLVGPRPLILEEAAEVREWAKRRSSLRPGMTGLWQVHGNSSISFGDMVKLDYLYVTSWSLWNDIRLLLRTVPLVLKGGGGHH